MVEAALSRRLDVVAAGQVEDGMMPRADDPVANAGAVLQRRALVRADRAGGVDRVAVADEQHLQAVHLDFGHARFGRSASAQTSCFMEMRSLGRSGSLPANGAQLRTFRPRPRAAAVIRQAKGASGPAAHPLMSVGNSLCDQATRPPWRTRTGEPDGTRSYRSMMSWFMKRMQPDEPDVPMVQYSGDPCRRYSVSLPFWNR